MRVACLHDREEILRHLERDPYLHLYGIGDLDPFFWPYTTWYGLTDGAEAPGGDIRAIVLVYAGPDLPTVIALSADAGPAAELLALVDRLLPARFYAHVSPGLESVLSETRDLELVAEHLKMALGDPATVSTVDSSGVTNLGPQDAAELRKLYDEAYPGNWFDPRMLETGQYFGLRKHGTLVSAAGIHVFSRKYRVAALGNIVTHQQSRRRGYGTKVTAAVCGSLAGAGARIGLNVQADNAGAINTYRKLGFEVAAHYTELTVAGVRQEAGVRLEGGA